MKTLLVTLAVLVGIPLATLAAPSLVNVSGASQIAVNGYDPVAFFTEGKPVHGDPSIKTTHENVVYLFSKESHRHMFTKNPSKYAPQYGGFCAYGAAVGALFPIDINTWQIRNQKLYLNLNPTILKAFNADFAGNEKKAKKNWPGLSKTHGK